MSFGASRSAIPQTGCGQTAEATITAGLARFGWGGHAEFRPERGRNFQHSRPTGLRIGCGVGRDKARDAPAGVQKLWRVVGGVENRAQSSELRAHNAGRKASFSYLASQPWPLSRRLRRPSRSCSPNWHRGRRPRRDTSGRSFARAAGRKAQPRHPGASAKG